jgi:gliding motility-associated-like protein
MTIDIKTTDIKNATYAWSQYIPDGTAAAGSINGTSNTFQINVTSTSTKNDSTYFVVMVTDSLTCTSNDTVKVKTVPLIVLTLKDLNSCVGDSVYLNGNPGFTIAQAQYHWLFASSPGSTPTVINVPDTTSLLKVKQTGTYYLDYQVGGCTTVDSANVLFNPRPVIALSDIHNCFESQHYYTLDAGTGPATDPYKTYQWFTKPDTIAGIKNTRFFDFYTQGKIYVTVTNANDCPTTDSLNALDVCEPHVWVPNAFTPGGNDIRDNVFNVFGNHYTNLELIIFSRWGEIIFVGNGSEGWDGTFRGQPMPIGEYAWVVTYEGDPTYFPHKYRLKGAVMVIR